MIGETVTILARTQTGADRYGKPIYEWPEPGTQVHGCAIAPRSSEEPDQIARASVYEGLSIYMPPGVSVGPHDRIVVRGIVYEVDGDPGDWRSPYSAFPRGVVVNVKRWEG